MSYSRVNERPGIGEVGYQLQCGQRLQNEQHEPTINIVSQGFIQSGSPGISPSPTEILKLSMVSILAWFAVVFGINSMGNAESNCTRRSQVQFTALRVLLIPNTTANHAITY